MSSFDILAIVKMEAVMLSTPKYNTTSIFPNIVFHNPDSKIQDPLLRYQGIIPANTNIKPV